ncbi:hypothetical protein ACHAWF_003965 [Thalassiosira exigua]
MLLLKRLKMSRFHSSFWKRGSLFHVTTNLSSVTWYLISKWKTSATKPTLLQVAT